MVPLSDSSGELCGRLFIATELGLGSGLDLSWHGVLIQSLLPHEARGLCSPVGSIVAPATYLVTS
jgi:hypothetical protein